MVEKHKRYNVPPSMNIFIYDFQRSAYSDEFAHDHFFNERWFWVEENKLMSAELVTATLSGETKWKQISFARIDGRTNGRFSVFLCLCFLFPHLTWSIILADAGGAEEEKESSTPTVSMTLNSCLEEEGGGIKIVVWSVLEFEVLFLDHTFKFQYEWLCLYFLVLVSSGPRH